MGIAFALQAVCLVLVLTVGRLSGPLFAATLVATFFTWGEVFSLFPPTTADYFGARLGDGRFRGALVLVDSRHPGLDSDRATWSWLERLGVDCVAVATKVDKLTRAERQRHLVELEEVYSGPVMPVSAQTGEGLDELWKKIASLTQTRP